jgi:hypothetical protein
VSFESALEGRRVTARAAIYRVLFDMFYTSSPRPSGDSIRYICAFFYEGDQIASDRCTTLDMEAAS